MLHATKVIDKGRYTVEKFEYIPSVDIAEEDDYSWIWDRLTEIGGCECWRWDGEHSPTWGYPLLDNKSYTVRQRSVHHLVWRLVNGKWFCNYRRRGTVVPCRKNRWCVNPQHFTIVDSVSSGKAVAVRKLVKK